MTCITPNANQIVIAFPCRHSFHRACVHPLVGVGFICRIGLFLAIHEKSEKASQAVLNPDDVKKGHDSNDENENDGDGDELTTANVQEMSDG